MPDRLRRDVPPAQRRELALERLVDARRESGGCGDQDDLRVDAVLGL